MNVTRALAGCAMGVALVIAQGPILGQPDSARHSKGRFEGDSSQVSWAHAAQGSSDSGQTADKRLRDTSSVHMTQMELPLTFPEWQTRVWMACGALILLGGLIAGLSLMRKDADEAAGL